MKERIARTMSSSPVTFFPLAADWYPQLFTGAAQCYTSTLAYNE